MATQVKSSLQRRCGVFLAGVERAIFAHGVWWRASAAGEEMCRRLDIVIVLSDLCTAGDVRLNDVNPWLKVWRKMKPTCLVFPSSSRPWPGQASNTNTTLKSLQTVQLHGNACSRINFTFTRGDGYKPKRGTNCIEFRVPAGPWCLRKILLSSKNGKLLTPTYPKTRNSWRLKLKYKYKSKN